MLEMKKKVVMNIRPGTMLKGTDGPIGKIHAVIVDPTSRRATHVVASIDDVPGSERLLSISELTGAGVDGARTNLDRRHFAALPAFEVPDFIEPKAAVSTDVGDLEPHHHWLHPVVHPEGTYTFALHDAVPVHEIEIRRNAKVHDPDGHRVGKVREFLIDPGSNKITHLVVHETHTLDRDEVMVPLSSVDRFENNNVWLTIDGAALDRLPLVATRQP